MSLPRHRVYLVFSSLAILLFAVVMLFSGVAARNAISDADTQLLFAFPWPLDADGPRQALGLIYLSVPFVLVGCMAAQLTQQQLPMFGRALFAGGSLWLSWLYFTGIHHSLEYFAQRAWTASQLALGTLAISSALPLGCCCLLMLWLNHRR